MNHHRPVILVVDDEKMVLKVMSLALRRAGFEVLEALTGSEALEICRQRESPVDLTILDIVMPSMGGAGAVQCLRLLNPALKVLLVSGFPESDGKAAELLGEIRSEFLQKPFLPTTLVNRVREMLTKPAEGAASV
jgi:DNA-binding response OmpR family regulator